MICSSATSTLVGSRAQFLRPFFDQDGLMIYFTSIDILEEI